MSKALIVETDATAINILETQLRDEGFDVVVAHDGVEALRAMRNDRPDVVILNPALIWLGEEEDHPAKPGEQAPGLPVIVWNKGAGDRQVQAPLGFNAREVVAQVKALQRRLAPDGSGAVLRAGVLEIDLERWTVSVEGRPVALTAKEFALLQMLINAKGRVLTREMLHEMVWRRDGYGSRTVDVHVGRLRRKLGPAGRYIITVRGVGYRFGITVVHTSGNG